VPKELGKIVEVDQGVRLAGSREPNPPIKGVKVPGVERGCRKGEKAVVVPMEDGGCTVECRGDWVNRSTFAVLGEGLAVVIREETEALDCVGLGDDGAVTLVSLGRPKK
jgi:hypothetical protein